MNLENTVKKYRAIFASAPKVTTAHNDKGHNYVSPVTNEQYKSVTYFTGFIKDPSLANWKMNKGLEYIQNNFSDIHVTNLPEYILKAKLAPEGEFKGAGDIGTQVHAWREEWFRHWINSGAIEQTDLAIESYPLPQNADPEVISGCRAIKRFLKETGYIPVACELALVDDELKVGGCIDDLGVFPNPTKVRKSSLELEPNWMKDSYKIWMKDSYKIKYNPYLGFVDLKTSNQGKKPAYAYQVRGFYQRMIKKTFNVRPKKTYILHTSKEDGTYKLIDLTDMKFLEKDAEYLVHCSRSWDKVVIAFKPKVITI